MAKKSKMVERNTGTEWVYMDDPEEPGKQARMKLRTRNNPLGQMFASGSIGELQYAAGLQFCVLVERSESVGISTPDPDRVRVDGGNRRDPVADAMETARKLVEAQVVVGQRAYALLREMLVYGQTASQIVRDLGTIDDRRRKAVSVLIEWALDDLAVFWGLANDAGSKRKRADMLARLAN
jgi:hypothetical protein